jgi:hypothetical protein
MPLMARLSDSVPPEVKTSSSGETPRNRAISSRAASTASRASRPKPWMLEAFPNRSVKYGSIAASTSGWTAVDALWSR